MKKLLKGFIAAFLMVVTLTVTGIISEAAIVQTYPTYNPTVRADFFKDSSIVPKTYVVPASSEVVIPVLIQGKGALDMVYMANTYDSSLYVDVFSNAACTASIPSVYIGYVTANIGETIVPSTAKKTLYLKVSNSSAADVQIMLGAEFVKGTDRTIKSGNSFAYAQTQNKAIYTKFKAKKTGYIAVRIDTVQNATVNLKLCDNKKKALSDEMPVAGSNILYFGVQKGKTYYLSTKAYTGALYNIALKHSAIKEKSGSTKSKAVSIKKNKTVKGVQIANKKKSGNDWYKIVLKSAHYLDLTIAGGGTNPSSTDCDIAIKVIPASKNFSPSYINLDVKSGYEVKTPLRLTGYRPLPKGTYYIQVYKKDKKSSGWYSIKWN